MSTVLKTTSEYARNWRLNSLRFTLFFDTPLKETGSALFEEFFGLTPDAETHRRAEFLSEFSAEKGSVVYQSIIAGPKVDFLVSVGVSPDMIQSGFPVLPSEGNFEVRFSEAAAKLVANEKLHITRIALGSHFVRLVADKQEGYKILTEYIPGIRLDANCSDFQYRINRPRTIQSAGQEVKFNRLATWGCLAMKVNVQVSGGMSSNSTIGSAVSVTADVNTVPELNFSTLKAESKTETVAQLFQLAQEIPEKGDVS